MGNYADKLRSVFLVGFLLTVALALTSYIDSSFLGTYVSIKSIGILFSLGSLASIGLLSRMPQLIKKMGAGSMFHYTGFVYLLSILGMLSTKTPIVFGALFVAYIAAGYGIYFTIDLLIEHLSKKKTTGMTRGMYLAIYNLAYLLGPLLAGMILKNNSFKLVYLTAGIFIIIMMLVFVRDMEDIRITTHTKQLTFRKSLERLLASKNLVNVYFVSLMLSFFFSWMAIYTPIYLHTIIHFDWSQIGTLFAVMHIPYITLEVPLGRLADRYLCERSLMIFGFVIIGISTIGLAFFADAHFWLWALGLAATRVGASFVQE
jgi:MFS family permease